MARGTQHRKRRPTANARVAPAQPAPKARAKSNRVKHERWEDQLFFSRLRSHAKWVFVFLAFVFAASFVLFGVGSGSSGITEAMQSLFTRSGGGSSLSSLQNKAKEHPKDPKAWRDLATKLESQQKIDRATVALERYIKLKPKDEAALQEIAGLYTRRAADYYTLYSLVRYQQDLVSPTSPFRPDSNGSIGKALADDNPLLAAQSTVLSARANSALQRLGVFNGKSEDAYKRLVKIAPKNATYQLQLGEVAANLGDKETATTAYKAFLKLAPNDSLAPRAKQRLKELAAAPTATTTTAG
jgi:tetratricopeptide (TPR) repeat protein